MNSLLSARICSWLLSGAWRLLEPVSAREYDLVRRIFGTLTRMDLARQSRDYENAMKGVALRFDMIGKEVQGAMMPALTATTLALQEWLDKHAPQIKSGIDTIAAAMGRLPDPVKLALAAITSILPEMGQWNASSAALAIVIGDKLLPLVFRLTRGLTSLVAVRPAAWLLSLLGVGGAAVTVTGLAQKGSEATLLPDQQRALDERNRREYDQYLKDHPGYRGPIGSW